MAGFSAQEVAAMLGLPPARLRAYVRSGLLSEEQGEHGRRRFSFQDLLLLRTAEGLVAERIPPRRVVLALKKLRAHLDRERADAPTAEGTADDPVRPLTGVPLSTDGDRIVAHDGQARWQPESGQVLLTFPETRTDSGADADGPIPIGTRRTAPAPSAETAGEVSADDLYRIAGTLEETDPVHAVHTYRQALALDPSHADAHVNLGRLLHEAGELAEAERHYRATLRLRPDDATAAFNLAVAIEDQGRDDEALEQYERAITIDGRNADAHYNAARLYEKIGKYTAAIRHLRAYRELVR
jgi:Tfp pilus assembly protein PilF/DNA-binding transcriptional MerR regulator